ncbi:hypothetical protein Ancab_036144 [Ancistrocladus abbreviatus]
MKMSPKSPYLRALTFSLSLIISTTIATSYSPMPTFIQNKFLAPHNIARAAYGLPPLVWDDMLASYAKSYANQRRYDCALVHSNGPYGENIFWGSGTSANDWSPQQAVVAWVAEKRWYDYPSNSCIDGQECGHYTKVVWSTSRGVGCAKVVCDGDAGIFVICDYDPPGNVVGQWAY